LRKTHLGVLRSSILVLIIASLINVNPSVQLVSGYISLGKQVDFEYYSCAGYWHHYLRFTVFEWDSDDGIAVIRETNESAAKDYRLKIPEWSIIDDAGVVIGMWYYCPIWIDVSLFVEGMLIDNPGYRLYNYTVDYLSSTNCEINRTIKGEEYDIFENLYYNADSGCIKQWDTSYKYPSNQVSTVRLKYLEDGWPSTITTQSSTSAEIQVYLSVGIILEFIAIIFLLMRRWFIQKG
jgi:hypothetical protein